MATRYGFSIVSDLISNHGWLKDDRPVDPELCGDPCVKDPVTGEYYSPYQAMAIQESRGGVVVAGLFADRYFANKPALASLENIEQPTPEHVRSCLLEMAYDIIKLRKQEPEPVKK